MVTQATRFLELKTPLDNNKILLRSFSGHEEMSRLFHFDVEFAYDGEVSQQDLINKLIGKNVSIRIDLMEGERFFNGFVSRVTAGFAEDQGTVFHAEIVPWLWFLTKTADCRIFQNKKTQDIIKEIFDDLGFKDYEFDLKREHQEREFCVQYRETDFNFVSRLMEIEGIFYFFKHEDGKHKMVIGDSTQAYYDLGQNKVAFPPSHSNTVAHSDHITSWERRIEFNTGKWAQTDYNFKTPSKNLMSNKATNVGPAAAKNFEIYDYPGGFEENDISTRETEVRMEEEETTFDEVTGTSICREFSIGGKFTIDKHHPCDAELGQSFVVTSVHHQGHNPSASDTGREYSNSFTCIPEKVVFRPARITSKPVIPGVQTAVVVGPKGEEIYTDEYGRVKVQFHWDRVGKKNENSSVFIRCAHNIAGNKWGFQAIPRIGQEVVVDFLEGDPDRPLIVGSVYNDEQMPHYPPKEHAAKTYIKTNSTKGGEGYNELMFDDVKDSERVWMHAQKDMDVRVLNDARENIHNNRFQTIGMGGQDDSGNQTELLHGNRQTTVMKNSAEHVQGSYAMMIGNGNADNPGVCDVVIEKKKREEIGEEGKHLTVEGDQKVSIGKTDSLNVGGDQMESIGANKNLSVKTNYNQKVGSDCSLDVGMNYDEKCGIKHAVDAGSEIHLKAGMKVIIEAGAQISLVGPGGFVDIGPAGVTIQGIMVKINSGGAAGSGSGASPTDPDAPAAPEKPVKASPEQPDQAWDSTTGHKSARDD